MNSAKKKRLESKGFKVGSVQEFLDLSPEESKIIELKITLGRKLQAYRKARRLTQIEFARKIKSSQSRVAKRDCKVNCVKDGKFTNFDTNYGTEERRTIQPRRD